TGVPVRRFCVLANRHSPGINRRSRHPPTNVHAIRMTCTIHNLHKSSTAPTQPTIRRVLRNFFQGQSKCCTPVTKKTHPPHRSATFSELESLWIQLQPDVNSFRNFALPPTGNFPRQLDSACKKKESTTANNPVDDNPEMWIQPCKRGFYPHELSLDISGNRTGRA
ncbi:MAG: hypothetical protein ACR2O4_01345, partial [Hyphomicrobiaceae bacterium]